LADVNAQIGVNIDTSNALAQLKALQREIARFHTSVAKSSDAAALAQRDLQKNFINGINAIQGFSAELRTVKTTAENFTDSLERNKFSMREYFRYSMASTKTFGRAFSAELDTVNKVATENVKRLQTQYIKMGRDANGAMKAIAVMPTQLDMSNLSTQTQLAAQKQAIFNQLVKQGSTNLLNFGKNTQWAGRQLMVGFTLPLAGLGSVAAKTFMDMETAAIKFKKVYGDLFTPAEETQAALDSVKQLGDQFTAYGIAVSDTVSLAADAAAAGFQGIDLQRQVTEATRLQILGQLDQQKALETTISLQNAFRMSSADLADAINFLNAVENQTVVSLDDITTAIPKAAPIVQELGGSVKDLAFFMAAMKEGGINASEGANALKSGLASLINPTEKAKGMLMDMGVNIDRIVESNVGNLKATVIDFAKALDGLSNLQRQRAIEQLFGKFQQARLSALFDNVIRDGNQAARVLDLAGASSADLASTAEKELGITADSAMNKFRASVEQLKAALVPIGEVFLQTITPMLDKLNSLLQWFNGLSDTSKKVITKVILYLGGLAPIILMTIGLMANFVANGIKGLMLLRNGFLRLTGQSQILGEQTQFLTVEQQNAVAAAASLEQSHMKLQQAFTGEAAAVRQLIAEYQRMINAQNLAATRFPGMMAPGFKPKGYAKGIVSVPGPKGAGDVVPAMVSPGEAIIPAKMAQKYGGLINGMINDNIPGFESGLEAQLGSSLSRNIPIFGEYAMRLQDPIENMKQRAGTTSLANVLAPLVARISEARGINPSIKRINTGELDPIVEQYKSIVEMFVSKVNENFDSTYRDISNSNERFASSWTKAGRDIESEVNAISSDIDRGVVRRTFGLDPDIYSTIPTMPRNEGGNVPERARQGAFRRGKFGIGSYTGLRPSIKALYGRITKTSGANLQMGHVYKPKLADITQLQQDPMASSSVRKAAEVMNMQAAAVTNQLISSVAKTAQTKSPSRRTISIGEDIARGLQVGMANQIDETKAMADNLSNAASGLINPSTGKPFTQQEIAGLRRVSQTEVGSIAESAGVQIPQQQTTRFARARGMVAKGVGRIAGAGRGFGLSGLMFGLSMLPGKIGEVAGSLTGLVFAGQALKSIFTVLPPQLKLVAGAAALVYGGFKLLNAAREKERLAIEGVGRAANLSAEQIKKLGDIYGFNPTVSPLATAKPTVALNPVQRTAVEQTKQLMSTDKEFKQNAKALATATKQEADIIFRGMALKLEGSGAPEEAIKNIIIALQEVAGRTDLKIDFSSLTLKTEKGQADLAKSAKALGDTFAKEFQDGYTKSARTYSTSRGGVQFSNTVFTEIISKDLKKTAATTANSLAASLDAISNGFANGIINAKQFNQSFNTLSDSITNMPQPASLFLMQNILKTLPSELAKSAQNIKNVSDQLLILKASALGVAISAVQLDVLAEKEGFTYGAKNTRANIEKQIQERLKVVTSVIDEFNKGNNNVGVGTKDGKFVNPYDKEIKLLNQKRDALKDVNDELNRQNQYQMKQMDLINQAARAKMTGNYLEAASLQQQSMFEAGQFTRESKVVQMDRLINMAQERSSIVSDTKKLTSRDTAFLKKLRSGNYSSLVPMPTTPNIGFGAKSGTIGEAGTNIGGAVYNITMNVTGSNSDEIANKVMAKLKVTENKNNKTNKVNK